MTTLVTVADFIGRARTLLQDTVNSPYRYSDVDLVNTLNDAFPEAKLNRPDLFIGKTLPTYNSPPDTTVVDIDPMYAMALVYYIVGYAQLRDDEEVQDQRAAAFIAIFTAKLKGGGG